MIQKVKRNFVNVLLIMAMVFSTFPMATITTVADDKSSEPKTTITDEQGVTLSKKATPVAGKLNEWEIELGVSLKAEPITQDIVVIIDTSGSMSDHGRMKKAKDAAVTFVDTVLAGGSHKNRVALISYSTYYKLEQDFTNSEKALKNSINSLRSGGGTFTQAAIKQGRDMLASSTAEKKSMVILTDGAPTFSYGLKKSAFDELTINSMNKKTQVGRSTNGQLLRVNDKGAYDSVSKPSRFYQSNSFYIDDGLYETINENYFEYSTNERNYHNMMGGHGTEASRYIGSESGYHFFLNLYKITLLEAQFTKNQGIDIHTVGLGLGQDQDALNMLKNMATTVEQYYDVDDNNADLTGVFKKIAEELAFPLSNIKLNDPMGEAVDLIGEIEKGNGIIGGLDYDERGITWDINPNEFEYDDINNIYSFKIKYRVKVNENAGNIIKSGETEIATNGDASLSYNKGSKKVESKFPVPKKKPTVISVEKQLYDDEGNKVDIKDDKQQRVYHYELSTENQEEPFERALDAENNLQFHYPNTPGEWKIEEIGIDNDSLSRFDVTYTDNQGNTLSNGKFQIDEDSILTEIVIHNQPKKEYQSDLELSKNVINLSGGELAKHGDKLLYTVKVKNTSEDFIRSLVIKDELSEIIQYFEDVETEVAIRRNDQETEQFLTLDQLKSGYETYLAAEDTIELSFALNVTSDKSVTLPEKLINTVTASQVTGVEPKSASAEIETGQAMISAEKNVADENNDKKAEAGEKLTYTITIKNTGNITAENVSIKDDLETLSPYIQDDSLVLVKIDGQESDYNLETLKNGFDVSVDANTSKTIEFTVIVVDDLDVENVSALSNTALVDGKEITAKIPTGRAVIEASKTVIDENDNDYAEPKEALTYTITATNTGNVTKKEVKVKDDLSQIKNYVKADPNAKILVDGKTSDYTLADLEEGIITELKAGESKKYTFTVIVNEDVNFQIIDKLINKAFVDDVEVEASIRTGNTDIKATKQVQDENENGYAEKGEKLTYTFDIENNGNLDEKDLFIQDDLSELIDYIENIEDITFELQDNLYTLAELQEGFVITIPQKDKVSFSFSVKLKDDLDFSTIKQIKNVAKIGEEIPEVVIPTGEAKLEASKTVKDATGDKIAEPGEKLSYVISVKNNGLVAQKGLKIQDDLKKIVDHVLPEGEVTVDNAGSLSIVTFSDLASGITVDLEAGKEVRVMFDVKVKDDFDSDKIKELKNTALVDNEQVVASIPTGKADIVASKTVMDENDDGFVEAGERLTYTIAIENKGEVEKKNLLVQDDLSGLIDYIESTEGLTFTLQDKTYSLAELQEGFEIDLAADEAVEIVFTVQVSEDLDTDTVKKISNVATIGDKTTDVELPTGKANIVASKSVVDENDDGFVEAGEKLTYTIAIANKGEVEKKNLLVQDDLSGLIDHIEDTEGISFVLQDKTYSLSELQEGFYINLKANESVEIVFTVQVRKDLDTDTVKKISNVATIGDKTTGVELPTGKAIIKALKSVKDENGDGYIEAGETITYTIAISNVGNVAQKDLFIQDDLADIIDHVENIDEVGFELLGETYTLAELQEGFMIDLPAYTEEKIVFTLKVKETLDTEVVTELVNKATIGHETPEVTLPTGKPDIWVNKSVVDENEDGFVEAGENLTYTIAIENKGEVAKKELFVQDDLAELLDHIEGTEGISFVLQGKPYSLSELQEGFYINLKANESVEIVFTVQVREDLDTDVVQSISNTATIGEQTPAVEIPTGKPVIVAEKSVYDENKDGYAEAGEKISYTISVKNTGEVAKKDLFVKDDLSLLKENVDLEESIVILDKSGVLKTYTVDELMSGIKLDLEVDEVAQLHFNAIVNDDLDSALITELDNIAIVDGQEVKASIPTGKPEIIALKEVFDENGDGYAEAGEKLTYRITVSNKGEVSQRNLLVKDTFEDLSRHIVDSHKVTFDMLGDNYKLQQLHEGIEVDLAADETFVVEFTVTLSDDFDSVETTELVNIASIGELTPKATIPTGKAEIVASKTVVDENNDGFVEAGEKLTYTIAIENKGEVEKKNLLVQDDLAELLDHIESTEGVSFELQDKTYSLSELQKGFEIDLDSSESVEIVFTVQVSEDLDTDTVKKISNVATIGDKTTDVELPTGKADIVASKTVVDENDDGFVEAGEKLTYTIAIENKGEVEKKNLLVQDDLSGLIDHIEDTEGISFELQDKTYSLSELQKGFEIDLAADEAVEIVFTVQVKEDLDTETVKHISNVATIGDKTTDVELPTGKADIVASKSVVDENDDGFVEAGERLTYTIAIANKGEVEKKNLLVQDDLSGLIDHIEDTEGISFVLQDKTYSLSELQEGFYITLKANESVEIVFTVQVRKDLDTDTVKKISNVATIGDKTTEVELPTGKAIIKALKSVKDENGDGYIEAGEKITYTIAISNVGNVAQKDLFIQDDLADIIDHVENIDEVGFELLGETYTLAELQEGFMIDLPAYAEENIVFTLKVKETLDTEVVTELVNKATIGHETPEVTLPTGKPDIWVNKSVVDENEDGFVEAGENLTYTIAIENKGEVTKKELFVQDDLAELLDHIEGTEGISFVLQGKTYSLSELQEGFYINLKANESVEIVFTVQVREDLDTDVVQSISNTATIGEQTPAVEIPTGKPVIVAEKSVYDENNNGIAEAGETLTYVISVSNHGEVAYKDLLIQDTLADLVDFVEDYADVSFELQGETYAIADLQSGIVLDLDAKETVTLAFTLKLVDDLDIEKVSKITNIATVGDETPGIEIVTGAPKLEVSKTVIDENKNGLAEEKEKLTYHISVKNTGTVTKQGVVIKDSLTHLLPYIEDASKQSFVVKGKQYLVADLMQGIEVDLEADEQIDIIFDVQVKDYLSPKEVKELKNEVEVDDIVVSVTIPIKHANRGVAGQTKPLPATGVGNSGLYVSIFLIVIGIGFVIHEQRKKNEED